MSGTSPAPQRIVPPLGDQPLFDSSGRPTQPMVQWMQRLSAFVGPVQTSGGSGGGTTNVSLSEQLADLTTIVESLAAQSSTDFTARSQIAALQQSIIGLRALLGQQSQQPPASPLAAPPPWLPPPALLLGPPPSQRPPFIPPVVPAGPGLAFVPPPTGVTYLANGGRLLDGYGAPNSAVYGRVGDLYLQLDVGSTASAVWTKSSGNNTNTGWLQASTGAGSGTVTSVGTGTGLTGGPITTSGTISFDVIANLDVLANISGGSAAPAPNTLTAVIDAAIGNTQGDILYRSGSAWSVLAPGTAGYFLQSAGAGANPAWATTNDVGRNYVGNPLMTVQQRGAGPFTTAVYTLDQWAWGINTDTVSVTAAAVSDTARAQVGDEDFTFALSNVFTGSAVAAAFNVAFQRMENVRQLAGKTVTVSFWANASTTLKVGVSVDQNWGTGGSPSAAVSGAGTAITLSTTWARYSATFAIGSSAGKTLGTNGDSSTQLNFWYSSGSTNATRAGSIGAQSGTINISGVQCEIGSVATPLEKKGAQDLLADCQRFYQIGQIVSLGYGVTTAGLGATAFFPVTMRAAPTVVAPGVGNANVTGFTVVVLGQHNGILFDGTVTATGSWTLNTTFTASAEL